MSGREAQAKQSPSDVGDLPAEADVAGKTLQISSNEPTENEKDESGMCEIATYIVPV